MRTFQKIVVVSALLVATGVSAPRAEAGHGDAIAGIAGLMVGVAAAAAQANAQAQQQAAFMAAAQAQQQAQVNAAIQQQACLQWLPVVYDQRYDSMDRMRAMQIVSACGIPAIGPTR